jgi:hypothetical protein
MKKSIFASSLACLALMVACGGGTPAAQEPAAGSKSPIGGECKADADCSPGLSCDAGDPGGQCQKKCDASADCGPGAVCSDEKKCYRGCKADADCRAGYACQGSAPDKFCDVANEGKESGEK